MAKNKEIKKGSGIFCPGCKEELEYVGFVMSGADSYFCSKCQTEWQIKKVIGEEEYQR